MNFHVRSIIYDLDVQYFLTSRCILAKPSNIHCSCLTKHIQDNLDYKQFAKDTPNHTFFTARTNKQKK